MEEARQYSAVTPQLASIIFMSVWTAIIVGAGAWSWRRWRRSRQTRVVRTLFGEIEETNFPTLFAILSASEILGVGVAVLLSLFGIYEIVSFLEP